MKKTIQITACALALLHVWAAPAKVAAGDNSEPETELASATAVPTGDSEAEPAVSATGISVTRLVVATDIGEREPVGAASEFPSTGATGLYAFVEVSNPSKQATEVQVSWIDTATGKERKPLTLQIGAHKRWRTWAHAATPKQPGNWEVVLKDNAGVVLARTPFKML